MVTARTFVLAVGGRPGGLSGRQMEPRGTIANSKTSYAKEGAPAH